MSNPMTPLSPITIIAIYVVVGVGVLSALGAWAYVISLAVRALHKYVNT